jgi:hypothetical protein
VNANDLPSKVQNSSIQTSAVGATWVAGANQPCLFARIHNATGTAISFRRTGSNVGSIDVPDGQMRNIYGVRNLSEIEIRRADTSNVQVTVGLEAAS